MRREQIASVAPLPLVHIGVPATAVTSRAFLVEIEIALLGVCFNSPDVIDAVAAIIEPDDFQEPINGRVFDAFLGRRLDGGKIDVELVTDLVTDLLLEAEGAEFVERYVDAVVCPRVKPKFPRQFAIRIGAAAKSRRGVLAR